MTHNQFQLFYLAPLLVILLTGCPPVKPSYQEQAGTFLISKNKLYDMSSSFDLRWNAIYPENEKTFDPAINVSNKELTFNRCTLCHECGFNNAFDYTNYGTTKWQPAYKGLQWASVVDRMSKKEGSLLNEVIAERINNFLRDVTLGVYDESSDSKGSTVVEVDSADQIPRNAVPVDKESKPPQSQDGDTGLADSTGSK